MTAYYLFIYITLATGTVNHDYGVYPSMTACEAQRAELMDAALKNDQISGFFISPCQVFRISAKS